MKVRFQRFQFNFIWNATIILILLASAANTETCNRKPQGADGERSPVDENFQILIDGNPSAYIPSQRYHVSLSCAESLKFLSFTLIVRSENYSNPSDDMVGHFEITDIAETKFSVLCKNMVESTNSNTKQRINVDWIAPSNNQSGCVLIQAAVLQHRNVWFINDGLLTKRICPEEIDDINIQTPPVENCCACDEAKYEIVLERKWTRNTHPIDFPAEEWRTRFSEIIGASHTFGYRFWEYGGSASNGLRLMAEHGSTRTLEEEIKENSHQIRTIIKAPGIKFRKNIMGTTLANVRVDSTHHIISLVTKIDPSPDWILGVAGLELCLINCTWIDSKVLNLYPWDIGTDEGATYTSPDQPQRPPDAIRRITSTFPSDSRSPFYDEGGAPMKPLAKVYITRKKLYERECKNEENGRLECATHPWNSWTECTTKCGPGKQYRSRAYKNPSLAERDNCNMELNQEQDCNGMQCGGGGGRVVGSGGDGVYGGGASYGGGGGRYGGGGSYVGGGGVGSGGGRYDGGGSYVRGGEVAGGAGRYDGGSSSYVGGGGVGGVGARYDSGGSSYIRGGGVGGRGDGAYGGGRSYVGGGGYVGGVEGDSGGSDRGEGSYGSDRRYGGGGRRVGGGNYGGGTASYGNIGSYGSEAYGVDVVGDSSPTASADECQLTQWSMWSQCSKECGEGTMIRTRDYVNPAARERCQVGAVDKIFESSICNGNNCDGPIPEIGTDLNSNFEDDGSETNLFERNNQDPYKDCYEKPSPKNDYCNKPLNKKNYWFYDAELDECRIFTANSCDENKNKFDCLDSCEKKCQEPVNRRRQRW